MYLVHLVTDLKMRHIEIWCTRFLIHRLTSDDGYGTGCPPEDWEDGLILEEGGCAGCKANFVVKFLEEHLEILQTV